MLGRIGFVREALTVAWNWLAYEYFETSVSCHKEAMEEPRTRNPPVARRVDRVLQLHECGVVRMGTIPFLLYTQVPGERTL